MKRALTAAAALATLAGMAVLTGQPAQAAPAASGWAWCGGAFGLHTFPGGLDLYNNEWHQDADPHNDTMCGNSGSDWEVVSDQRAGNHDILTYPAVQENYPGGVLVAGMHSLISTFAARLNATAGTDAEADYDLFGVNSSFEVMFWVDNHDQTPAGTDVGEVRSGGFTWRLWAVRNVFTFVLVHNTTAATVHLLSGLWTLQHLGYLPHSAVLGQANFGFEIASTGGRTEIFRVTRFTLERS